jgi:murein DD-endopeptidase MepM/ murein hydrolase activator NlpD
VIRGYRTPGVGDALDIFVPRGTGVRAMHGGWITRIAEPTGRLGCVYVEDHGLGSVYAHLHVAADLRLGAWVKEGTWLGWVGWILKDPHLHLELWIDGKAVSARSSAELAKKMARAAGEVSVG